MKLTLRNGPLYMQVLRILKNRIINDEYQVKSLIPPEPELKKEFDVSIITIRRAVEELALQGYVEKRSGIGTTVISNNPVSKLSKGQRFSEYLSEKGHSLKKEIIDISKIETASHPILSKYFPNQCNCMERLYTIDDQPYIHFRHYIPKDIVISDGNELEHSLYETMYNQGTQFQRFKDEFGVETPDERITNLLQIEKKPLLTRIRFSFDITDNLIEYSIGYYNTNIHKYVVNFDV